MTAIIRPTPPSVSSSGADFEMEYSKSFRKAEVHDRLAFVPTFQELGNYIINHDISYVIPITKSLWKLSIGMTNNFNSRPAPGVDELETLYYTRLVLSLGQGHQPALRARAHSRTPEPLAIH